jgi:hypothetical protein
MLAVSGAALAVAAVYYLWRDLVWLRLRRRRLLRCRLAYMLWVMAELEDEPVAPRSLSWQHADN